MISPHLFHAPVLVILFAAVCEAQSLRYWDQIASSTFTAPLVAMADPQRICLNDIVMDATGNIFATANNIQNATGQSGGLLIFNAVAATTTSIDLSTNPNLQGAVTKLVLAGDGQVYGLQNWLEVQWNYDTGFPNRILRFHVEGTVDVVVDVGSEEVFTTPYKRIQGMAVGDDGHVYYTTNGEDNTGKYHFLHRYNTSSATIEHSPMNGTVNNGWLESHRLMDLENVGGGWFVVVNAQDEDVHANKRWAVTAIAWSASRREVLNGLADPQGDGFHALPGRDHCLDLTYDRWQRRLWMAPRGANNRLILSRWNGTPTSDYGLFSIASSDTATLPVPGITAVEHWHADANAGIGNRWVSALAADPDYTGDVWMAVAGDNFYTFADRDHVFRYDGGGGLVPFDEGIPETGADVVGLCFDGDMPYFYVYALTYNRATGRYSIYRSEVAPFPTGVSAWSLYR